MSFYSELSEAFGAALAKDSVDKDMFSKAVFKPKAVYKECEMGLGPEGNVSTDKPLYEPATYHTVSKPPRMLVMPAVYAAVSGALDNLGRVPSYFRKDAIQRTIAELSAVLDYEGESELDG